MNLISVVRSACAQAWLISSLLFIGCHPAQAQKVYVGIADEWDQLLDNPTQWVYVRQNADGFYLNFIEMQPAWYTSHPGKYPSAQVKINATAALFAHKNAYFESDFKLDGQNEADDDRDIDYLQKAGFTIPYTSINTGWSQQRYQNLKTYHLLPGQAPRYSFEQDGPWTINGDIKGDVSTGGVYSNAEYRQQFDSCDGTTTDGPLGYWFLNFNNMQGGSFSMVRYAHAEYKQAVVMLCPYGAGVATYDAATMYLKTGEDCVRKHEDNDAEPDVWDVFEYATTIGAVPEEVNGAPALNSTTGMAYYLIKHLKGDPGTLQLHANQSATPVSTVPVTTSSSQQINLDPATTAGTTAHYILSIIDTSPWLDYTAVLQATKTEADSGWEIRYELKGNDITNLVLKDGFKFYQSNRIKPNTTTSVDLYITRSATGTAANFNLTNQLLPHHGQAPMSSVVFSSPGK